jgi:polyisoprenoid-binding protein YceI
MAAPTPLQVADGTAQFDAATNIPAISVHGESTKLQGRASVRPSGDGIAIEQMEATLPVQSLKTGMELRDEHMRKRVFMTADGQLPDLKFVADKADCSGSERESTCEVSGQLSIRGTTRPFTINLKVNKSGDGYHAAGDGTVKLSAYGIERPSQLGVSTEDEVSLHLDFTAKQSAGRVASGWEVR